MLSQPVLCWGGCTMVFLGVQDARTYSAFSPLQAAHQLVGAGNPGFTLIERVWLPLRLCSGWQQSACASCKQTMMPLCGCWTKRQVGGTWLALDLLFVAG